MIIPKRVQQPMTDNSFQEGMRRKASQGTMAEDTLHQTKDSHRKSKR